MTRHYTYEEALAAAERIGWRVEDLINEDRRLDFGRPFLPEALARVEGLDFLSPGEKLKLNQIRGHFYLYMFGAVEEFILPFVLDHARRDLGGDDYRTRAFLQFAGEEAKHIHLFKAFRRDFIEGFGTECDVIGPPEAIAAAVLDQPPLAVALAILHIEWMTQRHWVECARDDGDLDPQFRSLLKHHWMEEAQHAKLDTLMVEALAAECDEETVAAGIAGYAEIGAFFDGGLRQQAAFDYESLCEATGRRFAADEKARFLEVQHQVLRYTFLGSGMTHPNFLDTVAAISPAARAEVEAAASAFM